MELKNTGSLTSSRNGFIIHEPLIPGLLLYETEIYQVIGGFPIINRQRNSRA